MIKLVIFDYDDTIVASSEALYKLDCKTAETLGLKNPTREQYFAVWGKPHNEMIKALHPEIDLTLYQNTYQSLYSQDVLKLLPDVENVLRGLKRQGKKLALLSSKSNKYLTDSLVHLGIGDLFGYIHSAETSPCHKPDPRVFEDILPHFNLRLEEIIYVGDQVTDFQAAKKAGINFIAVTTGINTRDDFRRAGCEQIIAALTELKL